jgi:catechol 2,3-dioxygenase
LEEGDVNDFNRIPPETHIGHVVLRAPDHEAGLQFYRDLLGFRVFHREGERVFLSAPGEDTSHIVLAQSPGARPKPPRTTGLFHLAIRVPDRAGLGMTLNRLIENDWPIQGFADHGVSEAVYLSDGDGNGVEIYWDRPQEQWPWREDAIAMITKPLDVEGVLEAARDWRGARSAVPMGTDIGHIHLQVSDLALSEAFYQGILAFDVMQRDYPGALFLSAGGYHHHIGLNIWAGAGALPPPPDSIGLSAFSICLPDTASLESVAGRCREEGISLEGWQTYPNRSGFLVQDPDGHGVEVLVDRPAPYPNWGDLRGRIGV